MSSLSYSHIFQDALLLLGELFELITDTNKDVSNIIKQLENTKTFALTFALAFALAFALFSLGM